MAVSSEPILEHVCSFLRQVAASFPVEGVVVEPDMLLEPDIAIRNVIPCVRRPIVVRVLRSVIVAVDSYLRLVVIAVPRFVHCAMLSHGLGIWALSNRLVERWLYIGHGALGSW